jgi:FkbM family methyltransferase
VTLYAQLAFTILPYTRLELPGWGYLYRALVAEKNNSLWKKAPSKTIRLKHSGFVVKLNLANWSERHTYFLGRHYDLDLQLLLNQVLQPGDRFVDIGANIGMITLHAAALVRDSGHVDSFEPNPDCSRRLNETLHANNIKHARVHQVGLSDQHATLTLSVITEHSGMGTLSEPEPEQEPLVSRRFEVPVVRGDEILLKNSVPVKLVKIDVEGFEFRVLRGIEATLNRWRPVVVTEMLKEWLGRAGTSRTDIVQMMKHFGYSPYGLATRRQLVRHVLTLIPIDHSGVEHAQFSDFVWLHAQSLGARALQKFICSDCR